MFHCIVAMFYCIVVRFCSLLHYCCLLLFVIALLQCFIAILARTGQFLPMLKDITAQVGNFCLLCTISRQFLPGIQVYGRQFLPGGIMPCIGCWNALYRVDMPMAFARWFCGYLRKALIFIAF